MTRDEAIKYIKQWNPIHPEKKEAIQMAIEALKQPEIVRCMDCIYLGNPEKCIIQNHVDKVGIVWLFSLQQDWFCADGKRKEGD